MTDRVQFEETPEAVTITIAAPRQIGALLFLPLWWAGWTAGVVAVTVSFVRHPQPFLLLWLALAIPAWFGVLYVWLWFAVGKERLRINRRQFIVRREAGPVKASKTYETNRVRDLRASGYYGPSWPARSLTYSFEQMGIAGGNVRFDYDGKVVRFGSFLEEDSAKQLADRVNAVLSRSEE